MPRLADAMLGLALFACTSEFRKRYGAAMRRDVAEEMCASPNRFAAVMRLVAACIDVLGNAFDERTAYLRRDLTFTARSIRRSPGFAVVVVGTLAIAIGANAAVFSILRSVILVPLPFDHSERIVSLRGLDDRSRFSAMSMPDFEDIRRASTSFSATALIATTTMMLTGRGRPTSVLTGETTPQLLEVFGLTPKLGRFLEPSDARRGSANVVVLNERFWRKRFAANPDVMGSLIRLDDGSFRVVGVAPSALSPNDVTTAQADLWKSVREDSTSEDYSRDTRYFSMIGRMKPGVSLESARNDVDTVVARLRERYPKEDGHFMVSTVRLLDEVVGNAPATLFAIFASVCGVLIVACANVANLLLGRASAREQERIVRLALGAPRRRIVAQILTETSVLALLGAALGVAIASAAVNAFVASGNPDIPRLDTIAFDWTCVAYTAGLAVIVTIVSGVAPAMAFSRNDLAGAVKAAGRASAGRFAARARTALVVMEIACTLALVIVAGLAVRSFDALTSRPLGVDIANVTVAGPIGFDARRLSEGGYRSALMRSILGRVRAIPGIVDASWAFSAPFVYAEMQEPIVIAGHPQSAEPVVRINAVDDRYFEILRIPILSGRTFAPRVSQAHRVVVNRSFALAYFGNASPIGAKVTIGGDPQHPHMVPPSTIAGVVGDTRMDYVQAAKPMVYEQDDADRTPLATLIVRTRPGVSLDGVIADAITGVDPLLARPDVTSLEDAAGASVAFSRLTMQTLNVLALGAIVLAVVGIFAIVSYDVSQRTREFGIRLALGAQPRAIRISVLSRAMRIAALGIALGLVLAGIVTRILTIKLYDVAPLDPLTFGCVAALIALAAFCAAALPAWRATRVDPAVSLRYE